MHAYVVIASKKGRPIDPSLLDNVRHPDLPELFFTPESHLFWSNNSGSVVYCGWQGVTDVAGVGSHWHQTAHNLTAFTGYMWPKSGMWAPERASAEQLSDFCRDHNALDTYDAFFGLYTAVHLSKEERGPGYVITEPFSVAQLYKAENEEVLVISSRANLAARAITVADEEPERDLMAAGWLSFYGYIIDQSTGFKGVESLPLGMYVALDPTEGPMVRYWSEAVWRFPTDAPDYTDDELIDMVASDIRTSLARSAEIPATRRIAYLTGGRDSRLIFSQMVAGNLHHDYSFRVSGRSDAPDVVVARSIADAFGIDLTIEEPTPLDPTGFERRLRTHVFQGSGAYGAWDLMGGVGISRNPAVSGVFGEVFRSNYAAQYTTESLDRLRTAFMQHLSFDTGGLLKDEVKESYKEQVWAWVVAQLEKGVAPEDIPDVFYLEFRLRRWFGTGEEASGRLLVYPLHSLMGLRAAFQMGAAARRAERLHFEIVRRASPLLSKMPMANITWQRDAYDQLDDAEDYRNILPYKSEGAAATPWQVVRMEMNRDVFAKYLAEDPSNPIYELLDYERTAAAARGERELSMSGKIQLYGALTAAVWMGHHESATRLQR